MEGCIDELRWIMTIYRCLSIYLAEAEAKYKTEAEIKAGDGPLKPINPESDQVPLRASL